MKNDVKRTHFRAWKSGKSWLYGASVLVVLAGGAALSTTVSADTTATSSAATTTSTAASATPTVTTTSTGDNNPALAPNDATTINVVPSSTITVGNTYDPASNFVSSKDGAGNPLTIGKGVTVDASKVNTAVAGTYQVTYSVTDTVTGKVQTATANVTVVADQTSLDVTDSRVTQGTIYDPSSNLISSTDSNGKAQTVGKGVTVDSSKVNMAVPGVYQVIFQTKDSLTGQTITDYANVYVVAAQASLADQTSIYPTVHWHNDFTITQGSSFDPSDIQISGTDASGNSISVGSGITVVSNNVNPSKLGTYQVVYQTTDSLTGQKLTAVANVIVVADRTSLSVEDSSIPVGSTYDPNAYVGETVDASKVNTAIPGYYPVTYSVKKADGSTLTKVSNVIVTNCDNFLQTEVTTQNKTYNLATAVSPQTYSGPFASLTTPGMVVTLTDPNGKNVDVNWKSGIFTPTIVGTYTENYIYTDLYLGVFQGIIYIKVTPKVTLSSVSDLTETLSGSATAYSFTPSVTASDSSAVTVTVVDSTGKTISATSGSYALLVGTYTVTYTDANASNSPLTQTITVKAAPVASYPDLTKQAANTDGVYNFVPAAGATATVVDASGDSRSAQSDGSYNLTAGTYTVTYTTASGQTASFSLTVAPATTNVGTISDINLDGSLTVNLNIGESYNFNDLKNNLVAIVQQYLESKYPNLKTEIDAGYLNAVPVLSGSATLSILSDNVNVNEAGTYQIVYGASGFSLTFTVGDPQNAWTFNIDKLMITRTVNVKGQTVSPATPSKPIPVKNAPTSTPTPKKALPETGAANTNAIVLAGLITFGAAVVLAYAGNRRLLKLGLSVIYKNR